MNSILRTVIVSGILAGSAANFATAQEPEGPRVPPPPVPLATYTTVSGKIAQFNYNPDAIVEGFLLNDKTLVQLPPQAAPIIGQALRAGDSVEVAGMAITNPTGFRTIEAQQLKDRTQSRTFILPEPGPAAPYSASGRIRQLNYEPDGAVNGFLLDSGTLAKLAPFSGTNPTSIRAGVPVSFTGYARSTLTGRTVVDLQTLSVNGQTIALVNRASVRGPDAAPAPPAREPRPRDGAAPPPPAPVRRADAPPPPPPNPAAAPQF